MKKIIDDISIVMAGEAGQGMQVIGNILTTLLKRNGYNFFLTTEFMSRVRGGTNSTEIRVSSAPVSGFVDQIDILISLHKGAIEHLIKRITNDTVIIGDGEKIDFARIANDLGNALLSNTVAAGYLCGIMKIDKGECESFIKEYFNLKDDDLITKNIEAILLGHDAGSGLESISVDIKRSESVKGHLHLSGADSVSLGALAGGCDYVCGYPMSPSTSVLEKMAAFSKRFDIIVEQVEDEVGVINMALGAWYAGARAFITTSGGGFALMIEGVSLCGMIESPLVLHLAQRPGPATGLPTRTEQGDLNLVLYAGHGDFPRIILAPGTLEEGFELTRTAFSLADRYQVPVFILTDQFFIDSSYNTPVFGTELDQPEKYIVETDHNYKRFKITADGICLRGIPGYGTGKVCVDSDEHDEWGYITEDADVRKCMVDKRRKKNELIIKDIISPKFIGNVDCKTLIICWGSTFNTVVEAVDKCNNPDLAVLHFSWIYPIHESIKEYLNRALEVIIVENNSSGQFAQLIQLTTGFIISKKIFKYNGSPFSVEELIFEIEKYL